MTARPTHRGDYPLPYQARQLGRDLAGEDYARGPQPLHLFPTTEQDRLRWATPYRYLLQKGGAISCGAFLTAEELLVWCRAYAVTLTPHSSGLGWMATPGDPARWQPLRTEAGEDLPG